MLESGDSGLADAAVREILNLLMYHCGVAAVAPWCGPLSANWMDRLPTKYLASIDEMFAEFPNLSLDGREDADGLPHVVFGGIFCTWVEDLLNSDTRTESDDLEIRKAFGFIERR